MSRPDPSNPIAPLLQAKSEMQNFSDEELIKFEVVIKQKIGRESDLSDQRVEAFLETLNAEKRRRGL